MNVNELVFCMENASVNTVDSDCSGEDIAWQSHPVFAGVYLKHLVCGQSTKGQLSCHLVKVEPGMVLKDHVHPEQWELHEVIRGNGEALLGDKKIDYQPGTIAVIPKEEKHRVQAGKDGLVICAKFFPALL